MYEAGAARRNGAPQPRATAAVERTARRWGARRRGPLAEIVARTDELYEVSEAMQPAFARLQARLHDVGQAIDERYGKYAAFTDGGLKDPVRLHEKAVDDYATRFADGVLPEACVTDVVRARCTFTEAKRFFLLDEALRRGYRFDEDGRTYRMELVRGKNKFRALDPTHLRMMLYNLELVVEWRDEATVRAPPPSPCPVGNAIRTALALPMCPCLRCHPPTHPSTDPPTTHPTLAGVRAASRGGGAASLSSRRTTCSS